MSYLACNFYNNIALGRYSNITPWAKIGYNDNVDNVEQDMIVQGGTYSFPATATQMDLFSSSNTDNASGIGARTVTLYGLTAAGSETSEVITVTGTTAATTVIEYFRINNMRVSTTGTNYKPVGNLTLAATATTAPILGYIRTGYTRQRQCIYTVPTGKTLYVTSVVVAGVNASANHWCRFTTRATYDDKAGTTLPANLFMPFHEVFVVDQSFERDLEIPTKLPAGVDLKVTVLSDASNSDEKTSCALRGFITTP